jgi:tetratricopeptide (TPR) repeat protein
LRGYLAEGKKYIRAPRPELYDRESDPGEMKNLAPDQPGVVREMEALLSRFEASLLVAGSAQAVQLSDRDRRKLESLGYMAGVQTAPPPEELAKLVDIKDVIPVIELQHEVRMSMQRGDLGSNTLAKCENIIRLSPDTAIFRGWRGTILAAQEKLDEALVSFKEALRIAPKGITIYNNLAMIYFNQNRYDEAIENLDAALRIKPHDEKIRFNMALVQNKAGLAKGKQRRFPEAIDHFEAALEAFSNYPEAYHNLGIAYFSNRQGEKAVEAFTKALAIKPNYPLAKRNLGIVQRMLREQQSAPPQSATNR